MGAIVESLRFVSVGFGKVGGYLYLSRVPLVGLLLLAGLPLSALGPLRTLAIGAYDLTTFREAFFVGLALCTVAVSVFLTARIIWELADVRYSMRLGKFAPILQCIWGATTLLALAVNGATIVCVSSEKVMLRLLAGLLGASAVGAWVGWRVIFKRPLLRQGILRSQLLKWMLAVGLGEEPGYLKRNAQNEATDIEPGHASVIILTLLMLALYTVLLRMPASALVTVAMVTAVVVLFFSGGTFLLDRYRVPLLVVVLGYCSLMACWWQNDHYYQLWPKSELPLGTELLSPRTIINKTLARNKLAKENKDRLPLIVVASAGGGIQATAWTTAALRHIEAELSLPKNANPERPSFSQSIRLISGVSGGSVGGLFYAMAVQLPDSDKNSGEDALTKADRAAAKSGLGPAMLGLLGYDVFRALAPFLIFNGKNTPMSIYDDRGRELEKAWIENANSEFAGASGLGEATLSKWGADALALRRPALVFNSTLVETGERFAISTVPTSVEKAGSNVGSCEFAHRYRADLSMTTAARLSATFPVVSPTARPGPSRTSQSAGYSLPGPDLGKIFPLGGNYLHAVDGGYYENSGVVGAVEWLDDAFTQMLGFHESLPTKILFIELNAFPQPKHVNEAQPAPFDAAAVDAGKTSHGTLYDLFSPLPAIVNVRDSGQKAFAKLTLELFRARWAKESVPVDIRYVRIFYNIDPEKNVEVLKRPFPFVGPDPYRQPLSWHLRPCEKEDIERHLEKLGKSDQFRTIKEFLDMP